MRQSTWQRYFGDAEVDDDLAAERERQATKKNREFVTREGYRDFREWIKASLTQSEVEPGPQEAMLSQVGFRHGLRHVEAYLDTIEASVKGQ